LETLSIPEKLKGIGEEEISQAVWNRDPAKLVTEFAALEA